ncbi:MAG: hypothetical protein V7750_01265 [Sneathiella sp.]
MNISVRLLKFVSSAVLVLGISAPALADTLDFTQAPLGYTGSNILELSNATLTSDGKEFYVGPPGQYDEVNNLGAICSNDSRNSCAFDMEIAFTGMVENLSFASFVVGKGDKAEVSAYNGDTFLGMIAIKSNTILDFSSYGYITSLFFDDKTKKHGQNGIVYGDFSFESVGSISAVPLPPSILLFGAALAGLAFLKWKRSPAQA